MKILHFSDIHLGVFPSGLSWLLDKRILGTMTHQLRRRRHQDVSCMERLMQTVEQACPDMVVCTGDLGSVGSPDEFKRALTYLLPLVDRYGERFLYVPGNHDCYVNDKTCRNALQDICLRLNGRPLESFPWERTLDGVRVIAVNSAAPMPFWRSSGRLDASQEARVGELLKAPRRAGERRVLVSHYPLYKEDGRRLGWHHGVTHDRTFRSWLEDGCVDVLLCGHEHHPYLYSQGAFLQICAGALTLTGKAVVVTIDETHVSSQFINV